MREGQLIPQVPKNGAGDALHEYERSSNNMVVVVVDEVDLGHWNRGVSRNILHGGDSSLVHAEWLVVFVGKSTDAAPAVLELEELDVVVTAAAEWSDVGALAMIAGHEVGSDVLQRLVIDL